MAGGLAARRRDAVGPAGTPEIANRLGWLTIAERMLDEVGELERVRRRGRATTACTTSSCSAWAAPRSRRRCCGAAFAGRPPSGPRLHVLDSTDAATIRRSRARSTRARRCSSSPPSPAARSSRCRCSRTSGRSSPSGSKLRRDHRPRLGPRAAGRASTASGGCSPATRTSAGATARCRPFGIVPAALMGDRRARAARAARRRRLGRRAARRRLERPGCGGRRVWLGAALSALAQAGRDKLTFVIVRDAAGPRAVARAARGRVDGQARHGHPAGRRGAARRAR